MNTKTKPEPNKQLDPRRLILAEQVRNHWCVCVPFGTSIKDVLKPSFWAHHAAKLRPWEHIEIQTEDGSWYAELLVLSTDRAFIRPHLLMYHGLTTQDVSQTQAGQESVEAVMSEYEIMHRGPRKWSVVRKADRHIMAEDLALKTDAQAKALAIATAEVASQSVEA